LYAVTFYPSNSKILFIYLFSKMSAKVCQLCGKSLSRLRVGGDGDFCSREHRNQYGVRRGMDRLEEVNKIASLMRRRENPRHIAASKLMCNSALDRRGFFEARQSTRKPDVAAFSPVFRGPAAPRMANGADRYVPPRAARLPGFAAARRSDAARTRITGRGTAPELPRRGQKPHMQLPRAPFVSLRREAPAAPAAWRDFGMLRHTGIRVHLGQTPPTLRATAAQGARALAEGTHLCKIKSAALEGNALRVSIAVGFSIPAAIWRDFSGPPAMPAALVWPRKPRQVLPGSHNSSVAPRTLNLPIATLQTCLPEVPSGTYRTRFVFPGALAARNRRPAAAPDAAARASDISWRPSDPQSKGVVVLPPVAGFARRNGAHLFALPLSLSSTNPAPQVSFKGFVPREPVGCPTVAFEGTVAAAIASAPAPDVPAPAPVPLSAAITVEDHFGSGWENWMGGMRDWLVDVAGVRTGSLALFVPSLELIDYELEFLARIDTRSLTWVVRAAGLDEYLRCTLTSIGGGELEFSRCAVLAGVAEAPVTAPLRIPGKPRSAMTVGTRVAGDSFEVRVDGKTVDTWMDDRLPMGGIGFTGAANDRARLYWVRLSSTELTTQLTGKE
jgi:hypothetical protein